jgi:hypothetical protein
MNEFFGPVPLREHVLEALAAGARAVYTFVDAAGAIDPPGIFAGVSSRV